MLKEKCLTLMNVNVDRSRDGNVGKLLYAHCTHQQTLFEILVRAASSEDSIENAAKILSD